MPPRSVAVPAALAALVLAFPAAAQTREARHEATTRAMIAAIDARDLDRLDGLVAADFVRHSQSTPGVEVASLEDFKAYLRSDFAAVPDSRQTCPMVVARGSDTGAKREAPPGRNARGGILGPAAPAYPPTAGRGGGRAPGRQTKQVSARTGSSSSRNRMDARLRRGS